VLRLIDLEDLAHRVHEREPRGLFGWMVGEHEELR
jgi:hypothetical protein